MEDIELEKYELQILGNPIAASRPRVSRWSTYYTEPYKSYKKYIRDLIANSIPEDKKPVFSKYEPLRVTITFAMPIPESHSKKRKQDLNAAYHVTKPDLDNLVKAIKDAMNGLVYHDDGQVSIMHTYKFWSEIPSTNICVEKIDEKISWMK